MWPAAVVGAWLVALGSSGMQAASPPPPRPAASAVPAPSPVLEGTVKGPDGKPVEKALVLVHPQSAPFADAPLTARTDASGRFRLALPRAEPSTVRVQATGLAPRTLPRVRPGVPLAVTLERGRTIEGTVVDSAGAPIAGARVEARDMDALAFGRGVPD